MKLLTEASAVNGGNTTAPEGLAPMFFSERTVRYVREYCAAAGVDADQWAEEWIECHLTGATETRPHSENGTMLFEGIIGDILAPGNYELSGSVEEIAPRMLEILERYKAEEDENAEPIPFPSTPRSTGMVVNMAVPLWLRERIKQVAKVIVSGSDHEALQRFLIEQIGNDYLALGDAKNYQEIVVDGWTFQGDEKEKVLQRLAELREQWEAEEAGRPFGQPETTVSLKGGAL
jgi:hypothetical protein